MQRLSPLRFLSRGGGTLVFLTKESRKSRRFYEKSNFRPAMKHFHELIDTLGLPFLSPER
jgi:hypothetical protein